MTKTPRLRTLAAGLAAAGALAAGVPAAASAAGPVTLDPQVNVLFPTWWGTGTQVCAANLGGELGVARVDPFPYGDFIYDTMFVPSHSTRCMTGNWWGNPIQVTNLGGTQLRVSTR
jgi:hypothetical protein